MRGRESLRAKINERKSKRHKNIGGNSKAFSFNFLNTRDLVETPGIPYTFRILDADADKCPEGVGYKCFHTIEIKPGVKKEGGEFARVMGKEAWPDPSKAAASEMIDGILTYLDDPRILESLDSDVVKAVDRLAARTEYLFPTIWYGSWQEVQEDGELRRKFIPKPPAEVDPTGFIFSVGSDGLYDLIDAVWEEDPNMTSYHTGRNLRFNKGSNNRFSVLPELKSSPIDPRASNLISTKEYPNIKKMVNKGMLSTDQVEALLDSSWWWPYVSAFFQ